MVMMIVMIPTLIILEMFLIPIVMMLLMMKVITLMVMMLMLVIMLKMRLLVKSLSVMMLVVRIPLYLEVNQFVFSLIKGSSLMLETKLVTLGYLLCLYLQIHLMIWFLISYARKVLCFLVKTWTVHFLFEVPAEVDGLCYGNCWSLQDWIDLLLIWPLMPKC